MGTNKKGMMFVLSSPSGAGKTTLTKKISKDNSNFVISISHTTRIPRPNEVDGQDYYFVNENEFNNLIKKKYFFEHAKIFNNYYGTLKKPVLNLLSQGKEVLFDIDWQGTQQLKKNGNLPIITIFILPPNLKVLRERLLNRHRNDSKIVAERMKQFEKDVKRWKNYEFIVVNDNLSKCYKEIVSKIRLKMNQKKIITDKIKIKKHIKKLI